MEEMYNPYPKLPKNVRQIGDRDQVVKVYMEDYVYTYLKRLIPYGGQDLRVGLLLGSSEVHNNMPYIFLDGALEMEDVTEEGHKVVFNENAWKKAYKNIEEMFPKRTVQGWFLCGDAGCQLSPFNYWKEHHSYFPEKNKVMYLNGGLEGEEAIYVTADESFYKLRGHNIYYERNQMMQDYMILRKDVKRVDIGVRDNVIKDFRERMDEKKTVVTGQRKVIRVLSGACSVLAIIVIACGVVMFNNYNKMLRLKSVIASVMPDGIVDGDVFSAEETEDTDVMIVENTDGGVYPTETAVNISEGVQLSQETTAVYVTEAPTEETDASEAVSYNTYIIGEGETLYGICFRMYHSINNLDEICRINNLESPDKIIAGQKLLVP